MSGEVALSKVGRLQEVLASMPQQEFETFHNFADGMYARTMKIPAGTVLVGKLHRRGHFSILLQGCITISGGEEGPKTFEAPAIMTSGPNMKRAGYAHTDVVFTTVHRLDEDTCDLDEIERQVIDSDNDLPALFDAGNKLKDPSLAHLREHKELEADQ